LSTVAAVLRPIPVPASDVLRRDPAAQAFMLLRISLHRRADPLRSGQVRRGADERLDALPRARVQRPHPRQRAGRHVPDRRDRDRRRARRPRRPRFGGLLVAAWLGGIIVSLLLVGGYGDIALRDFGLLVGALALARLAAGYAGDRRRIE